MPLRKISILLTIIILFTGCSQSTDTSTITTTTDTVENALCLEQTPPPNIPAGDVLALAKEERPNEYAFAEDKGADILEVDNGISYAVWWQPEDFNPETDIVLVSLHGHGEWSLKGFEVWYPEISDRGYAFLSPEWWFGRSLESEGYYEPDQIYAIIEDVLEEKGIPAGHVIFEGFSIGSARSYGVTLYDKWCGPGYFGVSIANAGQWEDDYPLYAEVLDGAYGEMPFEETHWILFCGEKDYNALGEYNTPTGYKCDGMEYTQEVLSGLGGIVDLFLRDPTGDHGSFNTNQYNETTALDKAEEILNE